MSNGRFMSSAQSRNAKKEKLAERDRTHWEPESTEHSDPDPHRSGVDLVLVASTETAESTFGHRDEFQEIASWVRAQSAAS